MSARRFSVRQMGEQEDWEELKNVLGESRTNVQAVQHPEHSEKFRYLRPASVGDFAAGIGMSEQESDKLDDHERVFLRDPKEGFAKATVILREKDARLFVKNSKGKDLHVDEKDVLEVNPKIFDFCENMARLTHLNEATILHNLRLRYKLNLIHTYSGLFCITINPWRWLPLYSDDISLLYKGQPYGHMPPHVYAVADYSYNNMLLGQANQSILITGESGAGKTENTKKIINYFTTVAHSPGRQSLEQQIVATNPVLEAFGNAKTVYNDNSSRFGKFIRVYFKTSDAKIYGADVESYLLEKSRVICQGPGERSFHIFHMLLSTGFPEEQKQSLGLKGVAADYRFLANGVDSVISIDDEAEMRNLEVSLGMLGFSTEEKLALYQMTVAVLLLGEMKFSETSSGQAIIKDMDEPKKVAKLLGIKAHDLVDLLAEPTVKISDEIIRQSRNLSQVMFSVNAVAKTMYEKMFINLVKRLNQSIATEQSSVGKFDSLLFIGLLDVAGFEIFMLNSFEQLCINYTNERLQQFFNHRMFVVEQEIYLEEGIPWDSADFGECLESTINLIDKPMGIMSLLEEECMVPKGSDKGFIDKVDQQHSGKSPAYAKAKPSRKVTTLAHFTILHYAGPVNYNADGWIDKNKDPMNECMLELLRQSSEKCVADLWHNGDNGSRFSESGMGAMEVVATANQAGRRPSVVSVNTKSMSFMTVTNVYKDQLNKLMDTLDATEPHFIRCIVPNYEKKPGYIDGPLVLHQLRCNGVLEGIRICREGFPNRVLYGDFANRFGILASEIIQWNDCPTAATRKILQMKKLNEHGDYEFGRTKLFCRAGILGKFERWRSDRINELVVLLQAHIRAYLAEAKSIQKLQELNAQLILQANIRQWSKIVNWKWYKLVKMVRPMLIKVGADRQKEIDKLQEDQSTLKEELDSACTEKDTLKRKTSQLEETIEDINRKKEEMEKEFEHLKRRAIMEKENEQQEMEALRHELKKKQREFETFKERTGKEDNKLKEFKKKLEEMTLIADQLRNALEKERQAREEIERSNTRASKDMEDLRKTLSNLLTEKKRLETVKEQHTNRSSHLENQVVDLTDKCDKLMKYIKELEKRIEELLDQLHEERLNRRKVERSRSVIKDECCTAEDKLERVEKAFNNQSEQLRDSKTENNRLDKLLKDTESTLQSEIDELRKRHKIAVNALQEQLEAQHKKALKLESDNASMKAQLEHESRLNNFESTVRSGMQSHRNNSLSRVTKSSSLMHDKGLSGMMNGGRSMSITDYPTPPIKTYYSPEFSSPVHRKTLEEELMKKVEDLQKQIREIESEKRLLKRNLDVYKQSLEDESLAKDSLQKQLKISHFELERANKQLKLEEFKNYDQQHQLQKMSCELTTWKTKFEEQLVDKDSELDYERQRLLEKLKAASDDTETASNRVTQLGHYHAELQSELAEKQQELNRACRTIATQENLQRTQARAYEHLSEQYEFLGKDIEQLRVENSDLKFKIHQLERSAYIEDGMSRTEKEAHLRNELDHVLSENCSIKDELQRMRDSSVQLIENFNRELQNVKEELKQQDIEKAETLHDSEALKTAEMKINELINECENKARSLQLMETELELVKQSAEGKDKAIKELKTASQQFQIVQSEIQDQAEAHSKNASNLADQLQRIQTENARLEEALSQYWTDKHPHKPLANGLDNMPNGKHEQTNGFEEDSLSQEDDNIDGILHEDMREIEIET